MGPFQTEPAIEKRILELEEASNRQDVAIQKHNSKKAALERGIKRHMGYEPGQPSKKSVYQAAKRDTDELDALSRPIEIRKIPGLTDCIHEWDGTESLSTRSTIAGAGSIEQTFKSEPPGNQTSLEDERFGDGIRRQSGNIVRFEDTVQEPRPQTPVKDSMKQQDTQPLPGGEKQGTVDTGPDISYAHSSAFHRSFESEISKISGRFERVDINGQPAPKSRDKRAGLFSKRGPLFGFRCF